MSKAVTREFPCNDPHFPREEGRGMGLVTLQAMTRLFHLHSCSVETRKVYNLRRFIVSNTPVETQSAGPVGIEQVK
jgi:hypothetical protein